MIFQVKVNSSVSRPVTVEDICPNCKKPTNPDLVNSSYFSLGENKTSLVLTCRCLGCKHFWTEEFIATRFLINDYTEKYEIEHIKVIPNLPSDIPISDDVEIVSPIGKQIYVQALKAEHEQLDQQVLDTVRRLSSLLKISPLLQILMMKIKSLKCH